MRPIAKKAVVVTACLSGWSQALDTIQYGAFLPTATYSVANQLGFFQAYGLEVVYHQVPNSVSAFASLLGGSYDILTATVDNALNYRWNQGANVTVLGQLDQGPDLVLAAVPSITSAAQLAGRPIMVDSPVSGYAYLLRRVLTSLGLSLEAGDYYFMTVGGTATRYAALTAGALANGSTAYATILNYPFTAEAEAAATGQAPSILARVADVVSPITSSAFTVHQNALSDAATVSRLTRFLAAMYAANQLLLLTTTAAARNCSCQAIAAQAGLTLNVAAAAYISATNATTGEVSPPHNDFTFNHAGLLNDVSVRDQYGGFAAVPAGFDFAAHLVPGAGQLIDYTVRDAAVDLFHRQPYRGNCTVLCRK